VRAFLRGLAERMTSGTTAASAAARGSTSATP
jgi:hypothetical protein